MKWRIVITILLALLCGGFTVQTRAQLPNAWQIDDHSSASYAGYTNVLNASLGAAADAHGFDFKINARFVTDYSAGNRTMNMIYGNNQKRWEILWSLNSNGDLVSDLLTSISPVKEESFVVTANGTGRSLYHTHEIIYNPTNGLASYLVDGRVLTTDWQGASDAGWPAGQVAWGAGSSGGVGRMNFHSVSFAITNGVVAAYDAGMEPVNATDPENQGWSLTRPSLPSGISTNAVSPDDLPGAVTTLADSGAGSLRQVIASASPGDTITFFVTNGVVRLTSDQLFIPKDITILGPGSGNLAIDGRGSLRVLEITNATVTLDSLTLSNGYALDYGGGILLDSGAVVALAHCTLSDNLANVSGGGIYSVGTLTINSSTFFGNSAAGGAGGGIEIYLGTAAITNCTLSGNSALATGGGINNFAGTLALENSIVAGNSSLYGEGNLVGAFSGANNLVNDAPLLAPLGDYGGPTPTMPPLYDSPAIDAGDDSAMNSLTTDQRGHPRKSGAHVDIGAVEAQFAPAQNPPELMNPVWAASGGSNQFEFMFTNVPDADFTVLASTNVTLPLAAWTPLGNAMQNPTGQYRFTDPDATDYPQRVYRVVSP